MRNKNHQRFCVFCGGVPKGKNNEHVVPRWLIEVTGNPKRPMQLGPFINQDEPFMQIAFDQFRFPACSNCNAAYAHLEGQARRVLEKLLELDIVSGQELDSLLNWFDKLRVGLWLGFHHLLDKNYWNITPNFHISDRIGTTDRVLMIYRTTNSKSRLYLTGVNTPAFALSPTCFTLTVNNLVLTNLSADFLVSRRAGLPYPKSICLRENGLLDISNPLLPGEKRIANPIMGYNYDRRCTVVAQPIYRKYLEIMAESYSSEYIVQSTLVDGRVRPIMQIEGEVMNFVGGGTLDWVPKHVHDSHTFYHTSAIQTFRLQNDMLQRVRICKDVPKDNRRAFNTNSRECIKVNTEIISWIKERMI
ncbi:MAG: hypothetical protein J5I90_10295 [Caldilineales bacterium]|nr:hypothetical protein [Caldilineales bacterium]